MKIKSFIAPSLEEAMVRIHNDMGAAAVILETKECEGKGFKGFLGKALIEVIAAYPDENSASNDFAERYMNVTSDDKQAGQFIGLPESSNKNISDNISRSRVLSLLNERRSKNSEDKADDVVSDAELLGNKNQDELFEVNSELDASAFELANPNPEFAAPGFAAPEFELANLDSENIVPEFELANPDFSNIPPEFELANPNLKSGVAKFEVAPTNQEEETAEFDVATPNLEDRVAENSIPYVPPVDFTPLSKEVPGVDKTVNLPFTIETLKEELIDQELLQNTINVVLGGLAGAGKSNEAIMDVGKLKADVRSRIAGMVNVKNIVDQVQKPGQYRAITFVGPTGVGKTTTLAKVAAKLSFDYGKEVGVITIDTYRIAAVDQLMAYTDMIDIPIKVAYTPKELAAAVNGFNDKDFVLVDTVGRGQYDDKRIRMLKGLLKSLPSPENYLVMSAGTRYRDANDIFESFKIINLHGLVFTKIDETKTFGMLHNMIVKTKIPACFLTNGQEVPDDIVDATPQIIADLIVP